MWSGPGFRRVAIQAKWKIEQRSKRRKPLQGEEDLRGHGQWG